MLDFANKEQFLIAALVECSHFLYIINIDLEESAIASLSRFDLTLWIHSDSYRNINNLFVNNGGAVLYILYR